MTDYTLFDDYQTPHFPQTQKKRQTFPLTLAVATLAMILGIAVMIAIRSLPEGDNTPYAAQGNSTPIASPTLVASMVPTSTPMMMTNAPIELSVQNAGDLRNERFVIRNLGNTINLDGWALSDGTGQSYTFTEDTRLFGDATLTIHSTSGTNTPIDFYWGLTSAIFHDEGRSIAIFDEDGNFVSSVSNEISNLQPTTTPLNICTVTPLDNTGGTRVRNVPDRQSSVVIGTLPERAIAGVFEMMRSADGVIWYRIRADIDDAQISGWVMMDAVTEVYTPCPDIPDSQSALTTTPMDGAEPTLMPTTTPPQLCTVQTRAGEMSVFSIDANDQSTLQLATLPENTIAQVFEQMQDERQTLWYHIRADVNDASIIGWVNANDVVAVGENCPALPNNMIVVTAAPMGLTEPTIMLTAVPDVPDVNAMMSTYDYLPVVIAGLDIPQGTLIAENMLVIVYMPVETVQDMVSRNGSVISGMATFREGSRYATEDITRWQPLFMTQLAEGGGSGGN